MSNFRKQFKQGDDYCDIRADYRSLISIGKSVEETEDLLLRAYCCGPTARKKETCCSRPRFGSPSASANGRPAD